MKKLRLGNGRDSAHISMMPGNHLSLAKPPQPPSDT